MEKINEQKFHDLIAASKEPLIVVKENPDFDALGSALALFLIFKKLNKKAHIVCASPASEKYSFLPEYRAIEGAISKERIYKISIGVDNNGIKELSYEQDENILNIYLTTKDNEIVKNSFSFDFVKSKYDLILTIGVGKADSLGKIYFNNLELFSEKPVINVNRDFFNEYFCDAGAVSSFSIAENIAKLAEKISNSLLDEKISTLLLSGIIEKTNNFQSPCIRPEIFVLAGRLLAFGARREEIIKHLYGLQIPREISLKKDVAEKISDSREDIKFEKKPQENDEVKMENVLKKKDIGCCVFFKKKFLIGLTEKLREKRLFFLIFAAGALFGIIFINLQWHIMDFWAREELFSILNQKTSNSIPPVVLSLSLNDLQKQNAGNNFNNSSINFSEDSAFLGQDTEKKINSVSLLAQEGKEISKEKISPVGLPQKLNIPKLGINANIQDVGLTPDGGMGVPNNLKDVAWFNLGIRPGETGNAVIAGHLNSKYFASGVFRDLDKMEAGDRFNVIDEYGNKRIFRIVNKEVYSDENAPIEKIFGPSDSARLNLITCEGAWNAKKESYSQRLVIFAELES